MHDVTTAAADGLTEETMSKPTLSEAHMCLGWHPNSWCVNQADVCFKIAALLKTAATESVKRKKKDNTVQKLYVLYICWRDKTIY